MNEWWAAEFAGNEIWRLAALFGAVLAAAVAGRILHAVLLRAVRRLEETRHPVYAAALQAIDGTIGLLAVVLGIRIGISFLNLSARVRDMAATTIGVLVTLTVAWAAYLSVNVLDRWLRSRAERSGSKLDLMLAPLVRRSLRICIVILALIQVATLLSDQPVTSLLAGLGVGSLALALAAQDTVKNFFGSLVILADKPFELGERVTVDGHDGTVESVGFRSTRIRTLEGNLVTLPNGELANRTILNISKRPRIRRILNVAIPYDTPPGKVERAAGILKEILRDHEGMDPEFPPRVVFNEFQPASLNLLAVYWYTPPDWWKYMAFTEWVNYELLRRFNAEGIEFAFPTQTVHLAGDPRRPFPPPAAVSPGG